jgi:hypothetical protein
MDKNTSSEANKEESIKPDPKTVNTTDPQEEMEGPLSSLVQGVKENLDENSESKEEADEKKEENM